MTSTRFHEVCHVRGHTSAENLAERILRGTGQTTDMRRGIDMEPLAVKEYCTLKNVNCSPCGFIVHPDAPWLGSSPDGVIFDPSGNPPFGLLEVKCPNIQSYVDCPYVWWCFETQEAAQVLLASSRSDALDRAGVV